MFTTCSTHVKSMFTTCSRYVHDMFTTCSPHVHHMFTTCSQRSPHVHNMFMTCSQHVHNMFTTFPQHVHNMFTTCWQHVHLLPSPLHSLFNTYFGQTYPFIHKWHEQRILSMHLCLTWQSVMFRKAGVSTCIVDVADYLAKMFITQVILDKQNKWRVAN